jgi:hypothetical protein
VLDTRVPAEPLGSGSQDQFACSNYALAVSLRGWQNVSSLPGWTMCAATYWLRYELKLYDPPACMGFDPP